MNLTVTPSAATLNLSVSADGTSYNLSVGGESPVNLAVSGGRGPAGIGNTTLAAGNGITIGQSGSTATIINTRNNLGDLADVTLASPSAGEVLTWNGTAWAAAADSTNLTGYATESYVDNAVANLVDAAPGALDTLNELAAAIGDDANFSATITTSLASKAAANHTHAIANVTGLQSALDAKAATASLANVALTGNYSDLLNVPSNFAAANHTHTFQEITNGTATVTGNLTLDPSTGGVIISGGTSAGSLTLNCEQNTHGVTIESPAHSENATYTLTLPSSAGSANQVLTTDGNGSLSWSNGSSGSGGISWTTPAPGNSTDNGSAGDVAYGGQYFYLHNGTQWNRVLLSSFGNSNGSSNVTTYRLLTEGSDTLLTEGGDYLSHDGTSTGGNGTTSSGNWTQVYSDIDGAAAGNEMGPVALNSAGNVAVVGNPNYSFSSITAGGQVSIYSDNGTAWTLSSSFAGAYSQSLLGQSVDISSDGTAVVFSERNASTTLSTSYGWARRAVFNGSTWSLSPVGTLYPWIKSIPQLDVAISGDGDRVAVVYQASAGYPALMVFDTSAGSWSDVNNQVSWYTSTYSPSVLAVSLNSDGSVVAVGDPGLQRVHVWQDTGTMWASKGSSIAVGTALFGYSVSLSSNGNILAVGAPYEAGGGTQRGFARVYSWSGSAWSQIGSDITGSADYDYAGWSVDLSADGTRLAVGLRGHDGNGSNSGTTRLYDWNGSAWVQAGGDIEGDASNDYAGSFVSISGDGDRVAIGAPGNDDGGSDAGQVRVFEYQ